jgi:large subunit ribosomal protein L30
VAKNASVLRIRQVRSRIGQSKKQRAALLTLGLRRIGQVVERPDNVAVRGNVRVIAHLVRIDGPAAAAGASAAPKADETKIATKTTETTAKTTKPAAKKKTTKKAAKKTKASKAGKAKTSRAGKAKTSKAGKAKTAAKKKTTKKKASGGTS